MNMKKFGYIAIASLIALSSCSGFLDEELKGSLAPDNTYTSSHGFEVGVTGLYEYARSEWNCCGGEGNPYSHEQATPYEVRQIGTEIAITGHNDALART